MLMDSSWVGSAFGRCPRQTYGWDELAEYNKQVSQGIVHTPEHKQKMVAEQQRFDEEMRLKHEEKGIIVGD